TENILLAVSAASSNDVWAVGTYGDPHQPLVEHWNGSAWNVVPSVSVSTNHNRFNGVAAVSSTDVWAVGAYINGNDVNQTLIERWDGSAWSVVPSHNVSNYYNELVGVTALSSSDVWAVGRSFVNRFVYHTLIEHWNGNIWSIVPSPSPGTFLRLLDVAAVS